MSDTYSRTLTFSNYIFTGLFTLEMVLKLFALGFFEYVADSFNIFDGAVVILSIVEILLDVSLHLCLCDQLAYPSQAFRATPPPPPPTPSPNLPLTPS